MGYNSSPRLVKSLKKGKNLVLTFTIPNNVVKEFPRETLRLQDELDSIYWGFNEKIKRLRTGHMVQDRFFVNVDKQDALLLKAERKREKERRGY